MDAKIIELSNGVKGMMIDLNKDGVSIEDAIAQMFESSKDSKEEDNDKLFHDRFVKQLFAIRKHLRSDNISIEEAIANTFKDYDPEEDLDCYCPRCFARAVGSLEPNEIEEIGANIVAKVLDKCFSDMDIKFKRDCDTIRSVIARTISMSNVTMDKTKKYEDMSREELIAALKAKK